MMTVSFDPVAADLTVFDDGGSAVFCSRAGGLDAKHYQAEGILYLELRGEQAALGFLDLAGHWAPVRLVEGAAGWWQVVPDL